MGFFSTNCSSPWQLNPRFFAWFWACLLWCPKMPGIVPGQLGHLRRPFGLILRRGMLCGNLASHAPPPYASDGTWLPGRSRPIRLSGFLIPAMALAATRSPRRCGRSCGRSRGGGRGSSSASAWTYFLSWIWKGLEGSLMRSSTWNRTTGMASCRRGCSCASLRCWSSPCSRTRRTRRG